MSTDRNDETPTPQDSSNPESTTSASEPLPSLAGSVQENSNDTTVASKTSTASEPEAKTEAAGPADDDGKHVPTSDPDQKEVRRITEEADKLDKSVKSFFNALDRIPEGLRPSTYKTVLSRLKGLNNDTNERTSYLAGESVQSLLQTIEQLRDALQEAADADPLIEPDVAASIEAVVVGIDAMIPLIQSMKPYDAETALNSISEAKALLETLQGLQLPQDLKLEADGFTSGLADMERILQPFSRPSGRDFEGAEENGVASGRSIPNGSTGRLSTQPVGRYAAPSSRIKNRIQTKLPVGRSAGPAGTGDGNIFESMKGVPVDFLMSSPLVAAANANLALAQVLAEFIQVVGFAEDGSTRVVEFILERPVIIEGTGQVDIQTITVKAPLLALVPLPALLVQSVNIDLTVEVSDTTTQKVETKAEGALEISGGWLFAKAKMSASYTNTQENTRSTNQSAKYEVRLLAQQQPLPEGMSRLLDVMASCVVPQTS